VEDVFLKIAKQKLLKSRFIKSPNEDKEILIKAIVEEVRQDPSNNNAKLHLDRKKTRQYSRRPNDCILIVYDEAS
jgi:Txe/YoeB family toxin of Txe-Axe toxin-antitoxin module